MTAPGAIAAEEPDTYWFYYQGTAVPHDDNKPAKVHQRRRHRPISGASNRLKRHDYNLAITEDNSRPVYNSTGGNCHAARGELPRPPPPARARW